MAEKSKEEQLIDVQLRIAQAQLKKAEAELVDTEEELQRRENKRREHRQTQRNNAKVLADSEALRRARVLDCPHKKGGTDYAGWKRGTNQNFSIARWQAPNGDHLNFCTRCKNVVVPPVEPMRVDPSEWDRLTENLQLYGIREPKHAGFFQKDDKAAYQAAVKEYRRSVEEYNEWLQMPTDNQLSTSCLPSQTGGDLEWKRLFRVALHQSEGIPIFQAQKYHANKAPAPAVQSAA